MKQFLKNYWPITGIIFLMLAARLSIPVLAETWMGSPDRPMQQLSILLFYYADGAVAAFIISPVILYHGVESRRYRLSVLLKVFHLTCTVLYPALFYANWLLYRLIFKHPPGWCLVGLEVDERIIMFRKGLDLMADPTLILFWVGQVVFLVHLVFVLSKKRDRQTDATPEILDREA